MKTTPIINSLVGGVMSPRLKGRSDIAQYFVSAEDLLNSIVEAYGGAKNRAGFRFVAETKDSTKLSRNIPFNFNDTQAYNIELGDYYMRFYRLKAPIVVTTAAAWATGTAYVVGDYRTESTIIYYCKVAHTSGTFSTDLAAGKWVAQTIYEIPTPYSQAEIWDVQIKGSADIAYLFHKDHPIQKLSRTGHTAWTLVPVDFATGTNRPALMAMNVSTTTITPSADTGAVTLTASASIFVAGHVGSIWKIKAGWVQITGYTSGTVVTGNVLYGISLATGPAATADWSEGAWSAYRGYPRCGTFDEQRLMVASTNWQPQTVWGSRILEYENFERGADDADALDYTIATDQVETIKWLFAADQMGLGTSGGVHSLGSGSSITPLTASNVVVRKQTTFGVRGSEPINPGHAVQPIGIGSYAYYFQKYGRKLREYVYNINTDKFESANATVMAEHVTFSGVVDMAYQQEPDNTLWCVLANGKMAIFTKEIEQKVAAWAPGDTDGWFESVNVIPGEEEDEVWVIVKRLINGVYKRYVEVLSPRVFSEQEDWFFMDSGLSLDNPKVISAATQANPVVITATSHGLSNGNFVKIRNVVGMTELNHKKFKIANVTTHTFELQTPEGVNVNGTAYHAYESAGEARLCVTTITGLGHLQGREVSILADGAVHAKKTVAGGSITLDDEYSQVNVGLKYTSRIICNDLEGGGNQGTSQSKMRRISTIVIRFFESVGCKFGIKGGTLDTIVFRSSAMKTDQAIDAYTGDKGPIAFPAGWKRTKQVEITQEEPLPMHVLAIIPSMETND